MAATVSAWAKPGAWALDSEEHESELLKDTNSSTNTNGGGGGGGGDAAPLPDFPSLSAAVTIKPSKKKNKPQKLSLQELQTYNSTAPKQGLTQDELKVLPTGPRERVDGEIDPPRGFRNYGERPSRDEQPRRQNRDTEFTSSRADETDDWGANKKSFDRRERVERPGFFPDSKSKADEVDNWASKKSFVPSSDGRRGNDRRGGYDSSNGTGGADSDNWLKKKEDEGRRYGNSFDSLRKGGIESNGGGDSDTWSRKGGDEVSGGRPRLNLQPRSLPVAGGEGQQLDGNVAKPKGSNPFGNARPREEVLKEKGQDPKEIEAKLEAVEVLQLDVSVPKTRGSNPFGNARPREEVLKEKGQDPKEIEAKLEADLLKLRESAGADGPGKRGFGTGGWRGTSPEEKKERGWRKPETLDASRPTSRPTSSGSSRGGAGPVEAVEDGEAAAAQNGSA